MKITNTIKRFFIKDYALPITIYNEKYFKYFLELYDRDYNCIQLWEEYKKEIKRFESDTEYIAYRKDLAERLVEQIKETIQYQELQDFRLKKGNHTEKNIFTEEFHNAYFIELDFIHANFSAFQFDETWEEYLEEYDGFIPQHIIKSKYFRQMVLGKVNPKRQVAYIKKELHELYKWMQEASQYHLPNIGVKCSIDEIYKTSYDSLVIKVQTDKIDKEQIEDMLRKEYDYDNVRVTIYQLKHLKTDTGIECFVKQESNGKIKFKKVSVYYHPQFYRYVHEESPTLFDLSFIMDKQIAKFQEPLEIY